MIDFLATKPQQYVCGTNTAPHTIYNATLERCICESGYHSIDNNTIIDGIIVEQCLEIQLSTAVTEVESTPTGGVSSENITTITGATYLYTSISSISEDTTTQMSINFTTSSIILNNTSSTEAENSTIITSVPIVNTTENQTSNSGATTIPGQFENTTAAELTNLTTTLPTPFANTTPIAETTIFATTSKLPGKIMKKFSVDDYLLILNQTT